MPDPKVRQVLEQDESASEVAKLSVSNVSNPMSVERLMGTAKVAGAAASNAAPQSIRIILFNMLYPPVSN
ncbi:MAG: hypothetical protein PVG75_13975 [Thioalkalispiraceae bacterium]